MKIDGKKLIVFLGAGLMACSSYNVAKQEVTLLPIQANTQETSVLENDIKPYRDTVEMEMNKVIAYADTNFIAERPCGNLNNWSADALLSNQTKNVRLAIPAIALLNTGGLRTSFNKGEITVGDIFKIMPFDNAVVWATMPIESLKDIEEYLNKTGGEPIAGAKMINGKLVFNSSNEGFDKFIVITSDYLANGGDKMYFFQKALSIEQQNTILRDCFMQEAIEQGILVSNPENRMQLK